MVQKGMVCIENIWMVAQWRLFLFRMCIYHYMLHLVYVGTSVDTDQTWKGINMNVR